MTIRKLAIGTAMALILTATANARPTIDLSKEFCGARYCGQYQVYKPYKKIVRKKSHKRARIVAHKEKRVQVASLGPVDFEPSQPIQGLIAKARKYLGTNPTGWRRLWCGRFMAMIAPQAAKKIGNPNLAINWAKLPRVAPRVGAILITRRNGGNHVGVVIGFKNGNPITISGNHNRKVGIGVYSKTKIIAYVAA